MTNRFKTAYPLTRARSKQEADNRENKNLVEAARRSGLKNVREQHEEIASNGQLLIFDAAGSFNGHLCLFDLSLDYRDGNAPAQRTIDVQTRKQDWAQRNGYTHAIIYRHGDMTDFRIGIKADVAKWLKKNGLLVGSGWL